MMNSRIDEFSDIEFEEVVKKSLSLADVARKLGYQTKSGATWETIKARIAALYISTTHFTSQKGQERNNENVFIENSTADQKTLRKYFVNGGFKKYECSICGQLPMWNGMELTLILDHINGNNHDNRLDNLRWVCPNCNQQLDTTGSRNIVKKKKLASVV